MRRPRSAKSSPSHISNRPAPGSVPSRVEQLVLALNRLAVSLDRAVEGVAPAIDRRYKGVSEANRDLVSEKEMAALLDIKPRTLAGYRRKGKFPGCWVKNGKRVQWRVDDTLAAWSRGIA